MAIAIVVVPTSPPALALIVVPKLIAALLLSVLSYPIKIPSASVPKAVAPFNPINGFAFELPSSASNAITGVLPSAPILIVLCAKTSCENNISVATDVNVAPKVSQFVFEVAPLDGGAESLFVFLAIQNGLLELTAE